MTVKVNLNGTNELDFPSGVSSATTSEGVTTINLSGGGGATATLEQVFTGAGTQNFVHNLNSLYPLTTVYVKSGATAYSMSPVDANTMAVTVPGASDIVIAFGATSALVGSYSFTVSPTSATCNPTMGGTQTVNYTITQTVSGGYSGTVNYTVSGLASGMTGVITPTSLTGNATATLAVTFPATQPAATTTFTATGNDGTTVNSASPGLTVTGLNTGLIEGWQMNEGSGLTFQDAVASNNMTATGITWASVSGETGTFPQFTYAATGSSSYADAANQTLTNFNGASPFSISFWMTYSISATGNETTIVGTLNPAANYVGWEVGKAEASGGNGIEFFLINTYPSNCIQLNTSTALSSGTLYHVAVTYDGSKSASGVSVYVNGTAQTFSIAHNSLSASTANAETIRVGARKDGSQGHGGTVNYLRIYDAQLTSSQVGSLYAIGPR